MEYERPQKVQPLVDAYVVYRDSPAMAREVARKFIGKK